MSNLFVQTLREFPSDAEVISHKMLARAGYIKKLTSGVYSYLPLMWRVLQKVENIVREEMHCKVRSIELNVMQRCSSHLCSKTDIDEAVSIGEAGVKSALNGETGKIVVFKRVSDVPYSIRIDTVDAKQIANKEKFFPKAWINESANDVKSEAIKYFLPLIQGEVNLMMQNGLPRHFKIQESILR